MNECICHAQTIIDRNIQPVRTKRVSGITWAFYPFCPVHKRSRVVAAVYVKKQGDLDNEPASVDETVPVEMEG